MTKSKEHNIRMAAAVALLILLAMLLRNMWRFLPTTDQVDFITNCLRSFIYIGLFAAWGVSMRRRIIQKQARRYLTAISALMVFWILVRTVKFNTEILPYERYLWYLYYFPMLFIPLLMLLVSLSLGKPEDFRLPKWTALFYVPSVVLLSLVLTNDIHQLVFTFPQTPWLDSNNGYGVCYWLILGWECLCALTALAVMSARCRIPHSRRVLWLPLLPLSTAIIYGVLYVKGGQTGVFSALYRRRRHRHPVPF